MSRKLSTLLALALCIGMMAACAPSENDTTVVEVSTNETTQSETDITSAEMFEDDTTVEETEAEETTQAETETAYTDDTLESDITTQSPYTENGVEIPADLIFLNPDGEEFAKKFGYFDRDYKEPIVQYWDTGKNIVKFETYTDKEVGHIFKINGHAVDCIYVRFRQILVEDEYIIIVSCGTDTHTDLIYIFDYNGNTLFKTFYLSTTGMVHADTNITVTNNKIILDGTRMTHGPAITIGCNDVWVERFSEYSDYLYEDAVYDYSETFGRLYFDVLLYDYNIDEIKRLNPNEKTGAIFEMEYLGDGKFSKLNMVSYRTLGEKYPHYFE